MDIPTAISIIPLIGKIWKYLSGYPVIIDYVSQFETNKGYVFSVNIYTEKNKVVSIPKCSFKVKITLDPKLRKNVDKKKLLYGENTYIFESKALLQAYIDGRQFANVPDYVQCHKKYQNLFLLVKVKGPGSNNPSSRLQFGKVYKTLRIKIRKGFVSLTYFEIPIQHISLIAGNNKTKIIES